MTISRFVAIVIGVYLGLVMGVLLSQEPEGAMGQHPIPPAVGMTGPSYVARARLTDANAGIADTEIAYFNLLIQGDNGRGYGVIVAGDRDLKIMTWLQDAMQRGKVVRVTLEEIE